MVSKIILSCGILAPLVYLAIDLLAGKHFKGYSFSVNSMSDLSAGGSPTRNLVVVLTIIASALLVTFGLGIWRTIGTVTLPRIVAGLIIANGVLGLTATLFFPNQIGTRPAFGTPGVLLMFLSVLCFILAMIFGAIAFHGWMRILSIAIPASYFFLTILRFITSASSTAGDNVLIGAQERTMAYSFLFWVLNLAIYLLTMSIRVQVPVNSLNG